MGVTIMKNEEKSNEEYALNNATRDFVNLVLHTAVKVGHFRLTDDEYDNFFYAFEKKAELLAACATRYIYCEAVQALDMFVYERGDQQREQTP